MRVLVFCAAAIVLASGQNCSEGDGNCNSVVSYVDAGETENDHTRHRRGVIVVPQDMKDILAVSSTVTSNLADLKISQNFATTFMKIKPERLVSALKGFSIVASIFNAFLEVEDESTQKIVNKLDQGFDQLHRKMNSQTAELKAYIDHKFFSTFVVAPVKTVSLHMNLYKNNSNQVNKAEFLRQYVQCNMKLVVTRLLESARDILENVMLSSKYNRDTFNRMCSTIARNFHEAYAVDFFRTGVEFNPLTKKYNNTEKALIGVFEKHNKQLKNIITNATNYFETSFFPGIIGDDIVKVALDKEGGNNCDKALNISNSIHKRFPWRNYAVIVSDEATTPSHYAHFGYDARKLVVEAYSRKSVIVYMATKNFAKNKEAYLNNNEQAKIRNHSTYNFNPDNLWTIADFAQKITPYSQMAVHDKGRNPCLRTQNANVTDFFEQELWYFPYMIGGSLHWITTAVIF